MMDDLIKREDAIRIIEDQQRKLCPTGRFSMNVIYGSDREKFDNWKEIADMIETIPTVDPVKHGRWIKPVPGDGYDYCSVCKAEPPWFHPDGYYEPKYCPNCGANMDLKG